MTDSGRRPQADGHSREGRHGGRATAEGGFPGAGTPAFAGAGERSGVLGDGCDDSFLLASRHGRQDPRKIEELAAGDAASSGTFRPQIVHF